MMALQSEAWTASNDGRAVALSPAKLAILIPFGLALWALAWSIIRFRGPLGILDGWNGITLFVGTIPATVLINRLHLKIAGLPKTEIVNAVAVTLATATTIDAVCMFRFPEVYGSDSTMLRRAAAYIIWAGAVACWLAFVTRRSADRDLFKGKMSSTQGIDKP
jgi:hypothetical protein